MSRVSYLVAAIALGGLLSGCAARGATVQEIKYDPGRYHDRTVAIEGTVTSAWDVPLMPVKVYKVNDGTDEITVVSQDGRVPTKGARVRVKGRVGDVATLGGRALGLHLRQTDLDFKRR
jgi:hypothetical protein